MRLTAKGSKDGCDLGVLSLQLRYGTNRNTTNTRGRGGNGYNIVMTIVTNVASTFGSCLFGAADCHHVLILNVCILAYYVCVLCAAGRPVAVAAAAAAATAAAAVAASF